MNEVEKYIGKNYYRRSFVHSFLLDGRWEIDTTYSGVQKLGVVFTMNGRGKLNVKVVQLLLSFQ